MTEEYIIKKLRQVIPKMKCKISCSECCGPIIFSKWEWEQVKDQKKAETFDCPYASPVGCEIYKDRPIICRLFACVNYNGLLCPYGYGPEQKLPDYKGRQIMRIYHKMMVKTANLDKA